MPEVKRSTYIYMVLCTVVLTLIFWYALIVVITLQFLKPSKATKILCKTLFTGTGKKLWMRARLDRAQAKSLDLAITKILDDKSTGGYQYDPVINYIITASTNPTQSKPMYSNVADVSFPQRNYVAEQPVVVNEPQPVVVNEPQPAVVDEPQPAVVDDLIKFDGAGVYSSPLYDYSL